MYTDKTLTCRDCGAEFTFSASEQQFFAEKGFTNEPTRCASCRAARRNGGAQGGRSNSGNRQMYEVICDGCGATTQVPFQPRGDRPVYCRDCYAKQNPRY
ncbi:MAG TPA: zinc-ribbon domain containing protein [Candidatus Limiplasma sp.]|nr:zinc-ribbon domain containing protein [Candidatus Limiplasma sp.]HPS81817.1 zinc-ribbon domain containing protein [Candidatus Limiplasma sp.]